MNTTNPERLITVVKLLGRKKAEIDSYFDAFAFRPYGIDIGNCLINLNFDDAKKLLDFSFTTRQRGQNKSVIENYGNEKEDIIVRLQGAMAVLLSDRFDLFQRYESALTWINMKGDNPILALSRRKMNKLFRCDINKLYNGWGLQHNYSVSY